MFPMVARSGMTSADCQYCSRSSSSTPIIRIESKRASFVRKLARRPSGHDLLPEGREGFVLGPLHGHGADPESLGSLPEAEPLQHREPQRCSLGGRQLVDQALQPRIIGFRFQLRVLIRGREDIEPAATPAWQGLIEALVLPRGVSPSCFRQPDQESPVPEVVLQCPLDANLQVRRSGDWIVDSAAGLNELQASYTLGISGIEEIGKAAMKPVSQPIGEGQELMHVAITGGKRAHRGEGEGRHPHPAATRRDNRGKTKPALRRPPTTDR